MSKTVTLRIDDASYDLLKLAADGEKRSVSNFIKFAALAYLTEDQFVSDEEMDFYEKEYNLEEKVKVSEKEIKNGEYKIIG